MFLVFNLVYITAALYCFGDQISQHFFATSQTRGIQDNFLTLFPAALFFLTVFEHGQCNYRQKSCLYPFFIGDFFSGKAEVVIYRFWSIRIVQCFSIVHFGLFV